MGFLIRKPADEPGKALPAIVIGVFVAFGGVLFGFVRDVPSRLLIFPFLSEPLSSAPTLPFISLLRALYGLF